MPGSVYPVPAVKEEVEDAVSAFPITNELAAGVKDVTEREVEPVDVPVDDDNPVVPAPLISYTAMAAVATDEKVAVTVSAPEARTVEYQMAEK